MSNLDTTAKTERAWVVLIVHHNSQDAYFFQNVFPHCFCCYPV